MTSQPRKRSTEVLTPLELEIMQVLWEAGPSTAGAVQGRLKSELAYTTVQTMLNVLLRKKKVRRELVGRAFEYQAAVSRQGALGVALKDILVRMFDGSAEALVMALIDSRQITADELARASELLVRSEVDPGDE